MSERPEDDGVSTVDRPPVPRPRPDGGRDTPRRILERARAACRDADGPGSVVAGRLRSRVDGRRRPDDAPPERRDGPRAPESRPRLRVERRPASGLSWGTYNLLVAVGGLLLPFGHWLLPGFLTDRVVNSALIVVFTLLVASGLYRIHSGIDVRWDHGGHD